LNWSDVEHETLYTVVRWSAETLTTVVAKLPANVTNYTATGLTPETRQFFLISAENPAGLSSTSYQLAEMPPAAAPTTPNPLVTTVLSPTEIALTWNDSIGESHYQILHWTAQTGTQVLAIRNPNVTSYTATNLAPDTRHWFYVEAINEFGVASSGWQLAITPDVLSTLTQANDSQLVLAAATTNANEFSARTKQDAMGVSRNVEDSASRNRLLIRRESSNAADRYRSAGIPEDSESIFRFITGENPELKEEILDLLAECITASACGQRITDDQLARLWECW
jgi:hypothetical protein